MQDIQDNIVIRLNRYLAIIGNIVILTAAVGITLNAIGRYFLGAPIALITQGCYYLLPSIVALFLGSTLLKGGHIGAPILVDRFPIKAQGIAEIVSSCLVSIFSFFLCWAAFLRVGMAWKGHEYLPGFSGIPLFPFVIPSFFGILFLFLAAVVAMVESLGKLRDARK